MIKTLHNNQPTYTLPIYSIFTMKRSIILSLLMVWSAWAFAKPPVKKDITTVAGVNFHQGNWNSLLAKARRQKKPFFVDVYTTWCGPCKAMTRNTFSNNSVGTYANRNFVPYKLDAERGEGPRLARKYQVNAYPTILFFDHEGRLKGRQVGYQNANAFLGTLRKYGGRTSGGNSYQSAGVNFFKGSWNNMKSQASRRNKPFFVDVYTTWCGPCKSMTRNTFSASSVGQYASRNFVAYKLDAEKGEGPSIARKYKVRAYPTVLFFDARGNLVGRSVGYQNASNFIRTMSKYVNKRGNVGGGNSGNSGNSSFGLVTIYEHSNFKGRNKSFNTGNYNFSQLGIGNDKLSSIKIRRGYKVRVFEHANFRGRYRDFTSSSGFVGTAWNDKVSSMRIMKSGTTNRGTRSRIVLYEDSNYRGNKQSVGIGSYNVNQIRIGNDKLSSIRIPRGYKVRIYEHANFRGRYRDFTSSSAFVGTAWNDKASSLKVMRVR
ncbi:thioredoxin fold domain-containing protein [Microscilla marina]|uniref:Thioredoxin domain protein n=1 Tax=Microscilla marina ATCC 23134 TaxID=313606 RepID=A1ZFN3_MICM2|nr:thioredoxin fold domain-containing protein [Microscilla marina]EAY30807.1 thioredoxin domain protein [Microscilla marina ATCC 23134]